MRNTINTLKIAARNTIENIRVMARDEDGSTVVEYALIAALSSVAIIPMVTAVGDDVLALFNRIVAAMT